MFSILSGFSSFACLNVCVCVCVEKMCLRCLHRKLPMEAPLNINMEGLYGYDPIN